MENLLETNKGKMVQNVRRRLQKYKKENVPGKEKHNSKGEMSEKMV